MSTKVRPLNDRVLVKRMAEEEKTAGGLFIPDAAKEKPARGVVLLGKWVENEIKLDGEDHMILREEEILAVLEG